MDSFFTKVFITNDIFLDEMACTSVLLYKVFKSYPVVIANNRDEDYGRRSLPPGLIEHPESDLKIWAPRDKEKGGTWIGVNERGMLVNLTNKLHHKSDSNQRSRGILVLDALSQANPQDVDDLVRRELSSGKYSYCNVWWANVNGAYVRYYAERGLSDAKELSTGLHVITTGVIDDIAEPRIANAFSLLKGIQNETLETAIERLKSAATNAEKGILQRGEGYGTTSTTIFAVGKIPSENQCFYADHTRGNVGEFRDLSDIFL